jgi:hypothetical protein
MLKGRGWGTMSGRSTEAWPKLICTNKPLCFNGLPQHLKKSHDDARPWGGRLCRFPVPYAWTRTIKQ